MSTPTPPDDLLPIYQLEYGKLKDEQLARIRFRDQMVLLSLGVFGLVAAFVLRDAKDQPWAFLIIPVLSFLFGWQYITNDEKVSQIGKYVRDELSPKMATRLQARGVEPGVEILGWETYHQGDPKRPVRKSLQLGFDLLAFVAPSLLAVVLFVYYGYRLYGATTCALVSVVLLFVAVLPSGLMLNFGDYSTPNHPKSGA